MPELPEVETTLRGIEPHILYKKIINIEVRQPNLRWLVPSKKLKHELSNNSFKSIKRRGKYIILESENGFVLIHLGMSGCLRIFPESMSPKKHDHIDILFEDNSILRYTDPRKFGSFLWTKSPHKHKLLKNLGPEPLGNQFSGKYLYQNSRNRTLSIKNFIMDAKIVVGVGNIYANETLFLAGINPLKKAGKVSENDYEEISKSIKLLLQKSINSGGTTLRNFLGGDNKPGYFKQELKVYGRGGKECMQCNNLLQEIRISNRTSVYCKNCQK